MNLIIFFSFLTLSLSSMAKINEVSSGDPVSAAKINEMIQKINLLEQKVLPVGSVVHSVLTLTQFQVLQGSCWRLMDGASIAGTDLGNLNGLINLPNATQDGSFIRQASGTRVLPRRCHSRPPT